MKRLQLPYQVALSALFILVVLFASRATGQYIGFKDSVFADFTKEDHALFNKALNEALGVDEPNAERVWKNDKSGASGSITAGARSVHGTLQCRDAKLVQRAHEKRGQVRLTYCLMPEGQWKALK